MRNFLSRKLLIYIRKNMDSRKLRYYFENESANIGYLQTMVRPCTEQIYSKFFSTLQQNEGLHLDSVVPSSP